MRLPVLAATILLFSLFYDVGVEARAITKRHVRRDWLIIPDTVAFSLYLAVNNVSPEAGKVLMDIFETRQVQEIRDFLMQKTGQLTVAAEDYYQAVTDLLHGRNATA